MIDKNVGLALEVTARIAGHTFRFLHENGSDQIIRTMEAGTYFEGEMLEELRPLLAVRDMVIIVGANVGTHAIFFAGVCGCRVRAFESNPTAARLLRANVALNRLVRKISIKDTPLGATAKLDQVSAKLGKVEYAQIEPIADGTNTARSSVFNAIKKKVRLIKIDAKGLEFDLVQDAQALIERDLPLIIIEASKFDDYVRIAAFLRQFKYIVAATYNHSRTHLFVHDADPALAQLRKTIGHQMTPNPIESLRLQEPAKQLKNYVNKIESERWTEAKDLGEDISRLGSDIVTRRDEERGLADYGFEAIYKLRDEGIAGIDRAKELLSALSATISHLRASLQDLEAAPRARQALETISVEETDAGLPLVQKRVDTSPDDLPTNAVEPFKNDLSELSAGQHTNDRIEAAPRGQTSLNDLGYSNLNGMRRAQADRLDAGISHLVERIGALEKRIELATELPMLCAVTLEGRIAGIESALKARVDSLLAPVVQSAMDLLGAQRVEAIGASHSTDVERNTKAEEPLEKVLARLGPIQDGDKEALTKLISFKLSAVSLADDADRAEPKRSSRWAIKPSTPRSRTRSWQGRAKPPQGDERAPMPASFSAPAATLLADAFYRETWNGLAWAQPETELASDGVLVCRKAKRDSGLVCKAIEASAGGLFEVEVESAALSASGARRILRVQSEAGAGIGQDFALADGVTVARFFAPFGTQALKLYVLASDPKPGPCFRLSRIAVKRLDAEAHQRAVRAAIGQPVYATMATIPSRTAMLRDAVASLLLQCDRVKVFLNNYPEVPEFLQHPRVEIRRSQDWDDRGDAGKVFWLEHDRAEGGYRLIVDDDLLFPPDFALTMTRKVREHGDQAIFATHAVLLRQPVKNYYSPTSRAATFHFGRELTTDRGAHIGATNALCLHSSAINMRWHDFKYCNSADIWLSLYAQKHAIPVLTPARPRNWVRESKHENPADTIFAHSVKRTRSRFDSSLVQDATLRHAAMFSLRPAGRRKLAIAFDAADPHDFFQQLESFVKSHSPEVEWVIFMTRDPRNPEQVAAVDSAMIEHETHIIDYYSGTETRLSSIARLHKECAVEATIIVEPGARLVAVKKMELLPLGECDGQKVFGFEDSAGIYGAVLTNSSEEQPLRDSARAQAKDSAMILGLQPGPVRSISSIYEALLAPELAVMQKSKSFSVGTFDDFFQRRLILNLDRRPDRWAQISDQMAKAGISAQRFSAIDGSQPEIHEEYTAYAAQPIVKVSDTVPAISGSLDLYMNYASQMARIAHIEGKTGKKAITSPGAWGYLRSYETILEQALEDQVETLFVFDDDCVLHRDFATIFAKAVDELPDDWMIFQLGTLQYNWHEPFVQDHTAHLYRTNGSAIGSHAVGIRFDAYAYLLDQVRRMDMPFDIGALSAATRAFADRSFVLRPNLAIQRGNDSDIQSSDYQKQNSRDAVVATYRWKLTDYNF